MYLGEEGAHAQEEARTGDARRGGQSGTAGDVAESEVTRLSCGIDAFVWPPTGFATVKILQQPGQADHNARAMPARLDSEVTHKYAALQSQ